MIGRYSAILGAERGKMEKLITAFEKSDKATVSTPELAEKFSDENSD